MEDWVLPSHWWLQTMQTFLLPFTNKAQYIKQNWQDSSEKDTKFGLVCMKGCKRSKNILCGFV